jgi:hypothetical protein
LSEEIAQLRSTNRVVTPAWVRRRAAKIHRLGLYLPDGPSVEPADVVDDPEGEPLELDDELDAVLEPLVAEAEALEDEEEDEEEDASDDARERRPAQFGWHWFLGFMARNEWSVLAAHAKRRVTESPERIRLEGVFTGRIQDEYNALDKAGQVDLMANMDETQMQFAIIPNRTVERSGATDVSIAVEGNEKAGLTMAACIGAGGSKMALTLVMSGSTAKCEERIRSVFGDVIDRGELIVTHQRAGWCDSAVACQFLRHFVEWTSKVVRQPRQQTRPTLLWDVYAWHLSEQTKAEAERLGIDLEFIPAGKTGKLQPLDCRIFGELKARVRAAVERDLAETGEIGANVFDALGHFLKAWKQVPAENVVGSWTALLGA